MKKIIIFLCVVLMFAVFSGCNAAKQGDTSSAAPNESAADTGENPSADESVPDVDISHAESGDSGGNEMSPDSGNTSLPTDPSDDNSYSETSGPEPETSEPEESEPEVSEPQVSNPEVSEPEISEPEVSEPEVSEPDGEKVLVKIPTPVVPAVTTPVWDGSIADGFASGTGTEDDPFIIETAAQLAYFALSVDEGNDYLGQFVKLANNIKLNDGNLNVKELDDTGLNKWNAIGESKSSFMGTFDGDNHVISGMYGQGLFHFITGSVKNVGVVNSHLIGCGAIAGSASGLSTVPSEEMFISNCFAVDCVVFNTGGLFGTVNAFIVKDCYNGATVYSQGDWNGGIAGQVFYGKLINCYNAGTVDGRSEYGWSSIVGGIAGNLLKGEIFSLFIWTKLK